MKFELELENHYRNWKNYKENEIFAKAKENKNLLYPYINRRESAKSKIGQFKGSISEVEVLRKQYKSVLHNEI